MRTNIHEDVSQTGTHHAVPETPFSAAIIDHVTNYVGRPEIVLHETSAELFHLDVYVVPPADDRPFWFVFTTGMSALKMRTPYGAAARQRAELSMLLPPYWKLAPEAWGSEPRWSWPIAELRAAARLPHRTSSWFGWGHTFSTPDEERYGPDTRLSAMLLRRSISLPEKLHVVRSGSTEIDLWTLWPIYPEELRFKQEHGAHHLVTMLDDAAVSDVLDPARASAVRECGSDHGTQPLDGPVDTPGMKTNKMTIPGFDVTIECVPEGVDPIKFLEQQMDDCPLCREARARGEVPEIHTGKELGAAVPRARDKFLKRPRWRTMKRRR